MGSVLYSACPVVIFKVLQRLTVFRYIPTLHSWKPVCGVSTVLGENPQPEPAFLKTMLWSEEFRGFLMVESYSLNHQIA